MKYYVSNVKITCLLPFLLILLLFLTAACGGSSADQAPVAVTATEQPVPTMPAARFTAVSQQVYTGTTSVSASSTQVSPTPDSGASLARGVTIYGNMCASCHGEQGAGVADKGEALAGKLMTLAAFDDILRTGDQGELGPEHIFGPMAISPSGLDALYDYVQSLSE